MGVTFKGGAIVASKPFSEKTCYDVGNNLVTAQFDGRGAVSKYAVMNKYSVFSSYYSLFSIDGVAFDWGTDKEVTMIGRKQTVAFSVPKADIRLIQFLDDNTNAVYLRAEVTAKRDLVFSNTVNQGLDFFSYVKELFASRMSLYTLAQSASGFVFGRKPRQNGDVIRCDVTKDFYFDVAASEGLKGLEKAWRVYAQFTYGGQVKAGETKNFDCVLSAGSRKDYTYFDVAEGIKGFDVALAAADAYIAALPVPDGLDEYHEAYYKSLINCSLSSYKELGRFKGFLAGIVYQFPARTYYRDGYWTVLSVLPVRPDLVRNEIITLARGINKKTGECASAVKSSFKNYWGNHYDSPGFFAIMLYDYVAHTGDIAVLSEVVKGMTVIERAALAVNRLKRETDATGLLVKAGEYNRRDWCDNVFREGYVTYDEAVYARALYCMAELSRANGIDGGDYKKEYERVRTAINDLLWDDNLGYFVNYKSVGYTETNLSIDTVLIALFGLTDEVRARSMLSAMENKLESNKNAEQKAGDFGTLCVWPFYGNALDVVQKSSLPYYYHNGGDWPYLDGVYAYAKLMYGMEYEYPLTRWFDYNLEKGNYTPVEFFSPLHPDGSLLQAWSSTGAFVLSYPDGNFFNKRID